MKPARGRRGGGGVKVRTLHNRQARDGPVVARGGLLDSRGLDVHDAQAAVPVAPGHDVGGLRHCRVGRCAALRGLGAGRADVARLRGGWFDDVIRGDVR